MNDGQLRRLLVDHSPWRSRPEWERDDPDMRAAGALPLAYAPAPLRGIRPPGLYVLRGPRRVGKSLELKRAISELLAHGVERKTIFYCACDGLGAQDLRRLVLAGHNAVRTLPGPRYWVLDEITAVGGWSAVVKQLRDQNTEFREACVVLTGSSARDLREATKDLADRRGGIADSDRLLLPMGFRAFCHAVGSFRETPDAHLRPRDLLTAAAARAIGELEPWSSALDDAWQLHLSVGGFARAVGELVRDGAVSRGFVDALWDVIAGDAIRGSDVTEAHVAALLARLSANLGSPVNASAIATDVGLRDSDRVNGRVDDLVTAFLAWRCYRARSGRPNPAAQRKVYFVDPLIAQLVHLRANTVPAPDLSLLNEQQIGLHLSRATSLDRPSAFVESATVMFERTGTGAEIDFVGPELDIPFECKYEDKPWKRATLTMRARHGRGVLVTRTPLETSLGHGEPSVWAVPAGMLAWLIDRP
jgi:predicted AAA+ superfamily ATPase